MSLPSPEVSKKKGILISTIKIGLKEKYLTIRLNAEQTQAIMTIPDGGYSLIFAVVKENEKLKKTTYDPTWDLILR